MGRVDTCSCTSNVLRRCAGDTRGHRGGGGVSSGERKGVGRGAVQIEQLRSLAKVWRQAQAFQQPA